MPHDSSQLWRRDKPTVAHGPWFQQQDKPFWELQETWQPEPKFDTAKRLLAHTNPFHHADRYTITPLLHLPRRRRHGDNAAQRCTRRTRRLVSAHRAYDTLSAGDGAG